MTDREKVIIVAAQLHEDDERFAYYLTEMAQLVETANGQVLTTFVQKRDQIDGRHIVGKGKLEEIQYYVANHDVDVVIFYQSLSGMMLRNIQEILQVRVIDRVQLILDIFAMRARSKEGKLQVQLAQLQYLLPRLIGEGVVLSRLGGGIGTRGPGETKLEMNKRYIRNQITDIQQELKNVEAHRIRSRQKRQKNQTFQIGLIGYTNAGKSTLLNRLTDAKTYEKDELFATLDPLTRRLDLFGQFEVTITDTVGFIQNLPTTLIHAFKSTLEESRDVDLLIHVVDASAPYYSVHEETVIQLMDELKMNHIPRMTIYNKMDQVTDHFHPNEHPNMCISAQNDDDIERLKIQLVYRVKELLTPYKLRVPVAQQQQIYELQQHSIVENIVYDEQENIYIVNGYSKYQQ